MSRDTCKLIEYYQKSDDINGLCDAFKLLQNYQ